MSKFLTGKELEEKLTDIIWDAKKYVVLISPFIKLDNHVKSIFEKIKATNEVHIILVFGKNEGYKQKSFNKDDFNYFKEFRNISILYNKDLHAKHYCNESEALITSLNLYDYSMINNLEYGVHFTKNILNLSDKLFEETERFTDELIFEKSEVVFIRKPQYKKKLFGFKKDYQNSIVLFDVSKDFFNDNNYDIKYLKDFDYEELTDTDKVFHKKPQREIVSEKENNNIKSFKAYKKQNFNNIPPGTGYCIRTGVEIPFDTERPMCHSAWRVWDQFGDYDYPENYCHWSGKKSNGKTSMANPIFLK